MAPKKKRRELDEGRDGFDDCDYGEDDWLDEEGPGFWASFDQTIRRQFGEKYAYTVLFTNFFAAAFGAVIWWLCLRLGKCEADLAWNVLTALLGALSGWALGAYLSPYDEGEMIKFGNIGKGVSAFLTGYVASKLEHFLRRALIDDATASTLAWGRAGLFFAATLLVAVTVSSNRWYFRNNKPGQKPGATEGAGSSGAAEGGKAKGKGAQSEASEGSPSRGTTNSGPGDDTAKDAESKKAAKVEKKSGAKKSAAKSKGSGAKKGAKGKKS